MRQRSIESIDIKEDFQLRFHSREQRVAVLLRGWRDDRERERERETEKEVQKGWLNAARA